MAQSLNLSVSAPGQNMPEKSIVILTGSTGSPTFTISCTEHTSIQLVLPVLNEETPDKEKNNVLVDKATWEAITLKRGKLVNAKLTKPEDPLGVIEMSIIDTGQPASASFSFNNFITSGEAGSALCSLKSQELRVINPDDDPKKKGTPAWMDIHPAEVIISKTKVIEQPVITSLKASQYVLAAGEDTSISWETDNCDYCYFSTNEHTEDKKLDPNHKITIQIDSAGIHKYWLTACTKNGGKVQREITIEAEKEPVCKLSGWKLPESSTLMGVYPYDKNLYAIVLHKTPEVKAYLYVSESGLNNWRQVFRYTNKPVELDPKLAGSPGVVFRDRLYLIGGSSFDPDKPGSDIGFYEFKSKLWVASADMPDSEKVFPTPRMGHACFEYNKEIWLLGGYHPSTGTLDDIWTTRNGLTWERSKKGLPGGGRCMMGAVVHKNARQQEEIWVYGGFPSEPGGKSYGYADTRIYNGTGWETLKWAPETEQGLKNLDYKAFSLASVNQSLFLFSTFRRVTTPDVWEHTIVKIYKNNMWEQSTQPGGNSWSMNLDGYSLQTIVYQSIIWIRALRLAGRRDAGVAGKDLYYYFLAK